MIATGGSKERDPGLYSSWFNDAKVGSLSVISWMMGAA
jgi:hypothetical protein